MPGHPPPRDGRSRFILIDRLRVGDVIGNFSSVPLMSSIDHNRASIRQREKAGRERGERERRKERRGRRER